jgi:hypothetical protein
MARSRTIILIEWLVVKCYTSLNKVSQPAVRMIFKWSAAQNLPGRMRTTEKIAGNFGGRYRIRTYDFHRVRMALYR